MGLGKLCHERHKATLSTDHKVIAQSTREDSGRGDNRASQKEMKIGIIDMAMNVDPVYRISSYMGV